MHLSQILTGGDRNFGYLLVQNNEALIFDPGVDNSNMQKALDESGAKLRWLVGSHDHYDHVETIHEFQKRNGGKIILSTHAETSADISFSASDMIVELGGEQLMLLATPGHTICSICLLTPRIDNKQHLLAGDTLFVGKIGGTATREEARSEYDSLHKVLLKLDDNVLVWPGHNYGASPSSTIGKERTGNPFLIQPDFASFIFLKENWAAYKLEHGIN
jgi:hydroxyacylglutathione hydrolase